MVVDFGEPGLAKEAMAAMVAMVAALEEAEVVMEAALEEAEADLAVSGEDCLKWSFNIG